MNQTFSQERITLIFAYTAVFVLLTGFLFNRSLNNVGLLMAGLHAVWYLKSSWTFVKGPVVYALLLVILFPTFHDLIYNSASFLHTQNTLKWSLIVYPVFFAGCLRYPNFIKHTMHLFMVFFLFSALYSIFGYIRNFEMVNQEYGRAKVMMVLAYSDHIRMSWATVIAILMAFYLWTKEDNKTYKFIYLSYIIFQFIYIHILGSKTGILSLYATLVILIGGYVFQKSKSLAVLLLCMLIASPFLAYTLIPSFKNRVSFIMYDFSHYSKEEYKPGLSDAIRMYSLKGGWDIIKKHPVKGVGFSKIKYKMKEWYQKNTPFLAEENYFLPSSQFVLYWASCGILALLCILLFSVVPFFEFGKNVIFLAFFIPAVMSFLYEIHLETQTGVFVFGFAFGLFFVLAKKSKS